VIFAVASVEIPVTSKFPTTERFSANSPVTSTLKIRSSKDVMAASTFKFSGTWFSRLPL